MNRWKEMAVAAALTSLISSTGVAHMMDVKREIDPPSPVTDAAIGIRSAFGHCTVATTKVTESKPSKSKAAAQLECAFFEFDYQDTRLNEVYLKLRSYLDSVERADLQAEERRWLSYKDARCEPRKIPATIDRVVAATCDVYETARRATELEKRLDASIEFAHRSLD